MNTVPAKQHAADPMASATVILINRGIHRIETAESLGQQAIGFAEGAAGVAGYGASKLFKVVQHVGGLAADAAVDKVKERGEVTEPESQALKVVGTVVLGMLGIHGLL